MTNAFTHFTTTNRGALSRIAREIGVQRAAVCKWQTRGIPAERVLDVERATGIPRHALRPDLYPAPAFTPSSSSSLPAVASTQHIAD
jgi:DNA-binding transcriptional regulator YdaS (Cro superfamily)